MALAVLGVGLIAGGIVAYRGSSKTGVRSFAAPGIASGVVMLAVVVLTLSVSTTSDGSPRSVIETAGEAAR